MTFPDDEFLTKGQESKLKSQQKSLLIQIRGLLRKHGMPGDLAEFDSTRMSEGWEIMRRLCLFIENLASSPSLCDKKRNEAILFSPEASAEIVHLEANLDALKECIANIGNLAEKSASANRQPRIVPPEIKFRRGPRK